MAHPLLRANEVAAAPTTADAGSSDETTGDDDMPETFGKRARKDVKAKKAAAAEERRLARAQRRRDREAGLIEPGPPVATAEEVEQQLWGGLPPVDEESEPAS
jgi:hypothetical protein